MMKMSPRPPSLSETKAIHLDSACAGAEVALAPATALRVLVGMSAPVEGLSAGWVAAVGRQARESASTRRVMEASIRILDTCAWIITVRLLIEVTITPV
jgi:hypothetical protein